MNLTRPLYKHLPDPISKAYLNHIYLNAHVYQFGWMQALTGGVRSGKSMTLCTIADLLATHELDNYNFAFTPKEYLKTLDMAKGGEPLIWSELGTALSARKWYTISNILTTEVIQTMMIKRPIILIDTPDLSFIDVQARKLIYSYCEAKRWERNPVKIWVYKISINRKTGDMYFPHPLVKANGVIHKVKAIRMERKPAKEVWIKYDEKQQAYKEKLRKKHLHLLEKMDADMMQVKATIYDMINTVSKDKDTYCKNGKLNLYIIQTKLGVSRHRAEQIKAMIEKTKNPPT